MKKYPKYKESGIQWLGKVPEHWELCKVKHHYTYVTGFTPDTKKDEYYDQANGHDWVCIGDMKGKVVSTSDKKISQVYVDAFNPTKVAQGSLLYSFKLSVGSVAFAGKDMYTNEAIAAFLDSKDICLPFLYYSAPVFIVKGAAMNIYGAPILNQERILNANILFPPLSEQQAIAEYLDKKTAKIDESVAALEAQKADLQKYRAAVISEAVTRGLDAAAKMKDSGVEWIGQIQEGWKMSRLKHILTVNGRVGFKGYTTADLVAEGEGAYTIGGKHITNCVLDLSNADYISWSKYYESPEIMVHQGDIVMAQRGTLGKAALIREDIGPATINPSLVLLNQIKLNNLYLLYYLLSNPTQECIKLMNTATAVPMISQNQIENMPIPVPPLSEQQAIAEYLDKKTAKIDESIALIDTQITDLSAYRTALITEAVTGKVKVSCGE